MGRAYRLMSFVPRPTCVIFVNWVDLARGLGAIRVECSALERSPRWYPSGARRRPGADRLAPTGRCACDAVRQRSKKSMMERAWAVGMLARKTAATCVRSVRVGSGTVPASHRAGKQPRCSTQGGIVLPLLEAVELYKVFGAKAETAVEMLRSGRTREEVEEATNTVPAVIDVSFSIERGEIFVVMGLSGSGKSTLVRCLNLMHLPTSGSVRLEGRDLPSLKQAELRNVRAEKMSMVFQHFGLFPHRTVLENAAWGLEVRKMPAEKRHERAAEALALVGLSGWEDAYPGELSGGMQQRVGLARALATDADVLLMDEAFSALDPLIRSEMQEQLVSLQQDLQKTIVFITHDLNEAMFLGDRIAIMRAGRIVQLGTTEQILQEPADDYVRSFVRDVDRSRVLNAAAVMEEPVAKILQREGPSAALREMRLRQTSGVLVVDERKRLVGAATDEDVVRAIRSGERRLERIMSVDRVEKVSPDTPLADCLIPSAESRFPLAVVDEQGRLLGVIPRVTLLNALGGNGLSEGSETKEESTKRPSDGRSLASPEDLRTPTRAEEAGMRSDDEGRRGA